MQAASCMKTGDLQGSGARGLCFQPETGLFTLRPRPRSTRMCTESRHAPAPCEGGDGQGPDSRKAFAGRGEGRQGGSAVPVTLQDRGFPVFKRRVRAIGVLCNTIYLAWSLLYIFTLLFLLPLFLPV